MGAAMTPRAVPQCLCVRACSACSGDYEDPETTAWSEMMEEEGDEDISAGDAEQAVRREGFPAQEN
jgi:hypothetical protein